ncbi:molecular chaperone DjlA [Marinobacter sp. C2H3]|uniref:molecular chaperone DjlA n=1 Tax=Marinobacter sp. C2H3 TaxID=3119003 RepID=UPI00300EFD69
MAKTADRPTASAPLPTHLERALNRTLDRLERAGFRSPEVLTEAAPPAWALRTLFHALGYLAKADGRVTEADIAFTERVITACRLSSGQRRRAIARFQRGKQADDLSPPLGIRLPLGWSLMPGTAVAVAACLCEAAQLSGPPTKARRHRCEDAIDRLGLPMSVGEDLLEGFLRRRWAPEELPDKPATFEQACRLLGVTRRDSLEQMKRTYRKRVSECHPDKLAQQGLSPRELALAKERLLRYQQAWELIKQRSRPLS